MNFHNMITKVLLIFCNWFCIGFPMKMSVFWKKHLCRLVFLLIFEKLFEKLFWIGIEKEFKILSTVLLYFVKIISKSNFFYILYNIFCSFHFSLIFQWKMNGFSIFFVIFGNFHKFSFIFHWKNNAKWTLDFLTVFVKITWKSREAFRLIICC